MALRPSALALKLAPGEVAEMIFTASRVPADRALVVNLEGGEGAFSLSRLTSFREVRIPYTEQELEEFPAFPPSIRERRRREGKIELVVDGSNSPLDVSVGATLEVGVEVRADGGKGRTAVGRIRVAGQTTAQTEIPLALVVGSGGAIVAPQPAKLRVLLAPGQTVERSVVLDRVPVAATAIVVLDSTAALKIARVTAFRVDHFDFTEEEIAELPAAMRDEARAAGYDVPVAIAQVGEATPVAVPAGGRLTVDIAVTAPADGRGNFDGFLTIIADTWARIDVPVYPVGQTLTVTPTTQRIELSQGGARAKLALDIHAFGGSPPQVSLAIGIPGDPWSMVPTTAAIPLSTGGAERVPIEIWASTDAPVGEQATNLTVSWLDGLGLAVVPVVLVVRPGLAEVLALTRALTGSQGNPMVAKVRVHVETRKIIRFTAAFLPPGASFNSPGPLQYGPGFHELDLVLSVTPFAPVAVDQRVVIDWEADDGFHKGRLSFKTILLLTRTERHFSSPIITPDGIPLGGQANFILSNDGSGRFFGHMRATGFPSFRYQVVASVRSADGLIAVVDRITGKVFGTDSPGSRESSWDQPTQTGALAAFWPSITTAQMSVSRAFEFSGVVGTVLDTAAKLLDLLAGLAVLAPVPGGQALAVIVVASSDLFDLTGASFEGAGGLAGVLTAAGGAFLFGPGVIVPLFIAGAAASAALMKDRALRVEEQEFVKQVFGDTLPFDRIRLTNMTGLGGRAFTAPNSNGQILVNIGDGMFDKPAQTATANYPMPGQLLIHELVHAWQIQHGRHDAGYLWQGTIGKLLEGEHYGYGTPEEPFATFGLEGQASLVDEWFSGQAWHAPGRMVAGRSPETRMSLNDPYFHYIERHIRLMQP